MYDSEELLDDHHGLHNVLQAEGLGVEGDEAAGHLDGAELGRRHREGLKKDARSFLEQNWLTKHRKVQRLE